MIINNSTFPLYETHGINGINGIIGTNEGVFNSPNNTNSANNLNKPCPRLLETIGRKAAKQSRPFPGFVLPRSGSERWTPSALSLPVIFRACRLLSRVYKCDKSISKRN